jgi:uncharacterized membrane protein HdeD (DUF308 family)
MYVNEAQARPRQGRGGSIALGILLIILGFGAIFAPFTAVLAMMLLLGWFLIFAAIEQAVYAFQSRYEGGMLLKILLVALYGIVGVMLLRRPVTGTIAATAIVGTLFLLDGIMEIVLGFMFRRSRGSGWLFTGGILSLLFGALIWGSFPTSAFWVIGVLVGIRLVFKGMEHIMRPTDRFERVSRNNINNNDQEWPRRAA